MLAWANTSAPGPLAEPDPARWKASKDLYYTEVRDRQRRKSEWDEIIDGTFASGVVSKLEEFQSQLTAYALRIGGDSGNRSLDRLLADGGEGQTD
jgi:hypothetical protein